ncbi:MAG: hypothetical protein JWN86_3042 [Planctomycetota bacterium]|nr:hypothetical protein [Planctomycetota bacterium]
MANHDRRAAARRRAWGRGPTTLRFEPLEGRQLLSISDPISAIAAAAGSGTASPAVVSSTTDTTNTASSDVANVAATVSSGTATTATTTANSTIPVFDGSNLVQTAFDTTHNLDWGDTLHAAGSVQNIGSSATPRAYEVDVYASTTQVLGSGAVLVGTIPIAAGVAPGAKVSFDQVLTAPPVPLARLGNAPSYYLLPKLVVRGSDPLATTKPNATVGSPLNSVVTITPKIPPKLVGAGLSVSPGSVKWGDSITVTASVHNDSQGVAPPTNARIILTPVGKQPGGSSDYQIGQVPMPPLGAFQTATASQTIILPNYAPTSLSNTSQYIVTMVQDADAAANPLITATLSTSASNTTALTIATPATATPTAPAKPAAADLTVTNVQEPSPVMFRGATFPVGATIQNNGPGNAGPFKVRFLLITDESVNAPAYVLGDASLPGLDAGMTQDVLQTVTLPYRTPTGFTADSATARIVAEVDPDRSVDQTNTGNDSLAAARVQLKVLTPDGQTTVPVLPGSTTATNSGGGTTATTTPAPASSAASNFQSITVPAAATPTGATTTPTTPTTTPTNPSTTPTTPVVSPPIKVVSPPTKAAARQAALVARQAAAAARAAARAAKAAKAATVHAQVITERSHTPRPYKPQTPVRSHALRIYPPSFSTKA